MTETWYLMVIVIGLTLHRRQTKLIYSHVHKSKQHPWPKTRALVANSRKTNGRKTNQQTVNESMNLNKQRGLTGSLLSYGNKSTMLPLELESHGRPVSSLTRQRKPIQTNPAIFGKLSEQVLRRWIDRVAKKRGVSKWKDSMLEQVKKGNSPRGETTRAGILVRY